MAGVSRPSVRNQNDPFATAPQYQQTPEPLPQTNYSATRPGDTGSGDPAATTAPAAPGASFGTGAASFAPLPGAGGGLASSTPPNVTAPTAAPNANPAAAIAGLQAAGEEPGMAPLDVQSSMRQGLGQRNPPSLQGLLQVRTY